MGIMDELRIRLALLTDADKYNLLKFLRVDYIHANRGEDFDNLIFLGLIRRNYNFEGNLISYDLDYWGDVLKESLIKEDD